MLESKHDLRLISIDGLLEYLNSLVTKGVCVEIDRSTDARPHIHLLGRILDGDIPQFRRIYKLVLTDQAKSDYLFDHLQQEFAEIEVEQIWAGATNSYEGSLLEVAHITLQQAPGEYTRIKGISVLHPAKLMLVAQSSWHTSVHRTETDPLVTMHYFPTEKLVPSYKPEPVQRTG